MRIDDGGIIRFSTYVKPSALAKPLPHASQHPRAVHISWPLGQLCRFKATSDSKSSYREVVQNFLTWIQSGSPGHPCIQVISDLLTGRARRLKAITPQFTSRVILPYHPALQVLSRELFKHNVGVAWKLNGRHSIRSMESLIHQATDSVQWHASFDSFGEASRGGGGSFVFCRAER